LKGVYEIKSRSRGLALNPLFELDIRIAYGDGAIDALVRSDFQGGLETQASGACRAGEAVAERAISSDSHANRAFCIVSYEFALIEFFFGLEAKARYHYLFR